MSQATAGDLAEMLLRRRHRRNFCLQRYTPNRWWECDIFELTKAGVFREYEIKTTVEDFKKDAEKTMPQRQVMVAGVWSVPAVQKHKLLAAGDPRGPQRFWFVMPAEVAEQVKIPVWAGLIVAEQRGRWWCERVVKPADRLHSERVDAKIIAHSLGVCYWRMHDLAGRLHVMSKALARSKSCRRSPSTKKTS